MASKKRFRVALSFPREHRVFARRVASRLAEHLGRERVLYDEYHEAEFARPDLDAHLQELYGEESDLVVPFLSEHYASNEWCGLEWRSIRELIKTGRAQDVMPLRFDMTKIPGLFSGDGYIWVGDRQPEEIAERILERLDQAGQATSTLPSAGPPGAASTSAPAVAASSESAALLTWRKKLEFLLAQQPLTVDPDAKFRLQSLIDEAREKIRELGGS